MAASSRAQVLDLYRAMLRESKNFSAYNYRSTLANCIQLTSLSLRIKKSPRPKDRYHQPPPATVDHLQHPFCAWDGAPNRPRVTSCISLK
ncbi:LYR motif-containing protein 4 isoform X2 [Pteropus alecto]|uniref:LYR motif-containing protein 4 isoform X2 n=1 Tax=Pteropus alecto TaxID=9402 RepID=UPI000D5381BE|nr:LYR motif-containing protein 4 isoform X2 [Pteropus alecto]